MLFHYYLGYTYRVFPIFSVSVRVYLLPFFILGIGLYRYSNHLLNNSSLMLLDFLFLTGIFISQMELFSEINFVEPMILGIMIHLVSFSGIALLFRFRISYNPLVIMFFCIWCTPVSCFLQCQLANILSVFRYRKPYSSFYFRIDRRIVFPGFT